MAPEPSARHEIRLTAVASLGDSVIGLDAEGRAWLYDIERQGWVRVPMTRLDFSRELAGAPTPPSGGVLTVHRFPVGTAVRDRERDPLDQVGQVLEQAFLRDPDQTEHPYIIVQFPSVRRSYLDRGGVLERA